MTLVQAAAAITLWNSRKFDTRDIAHALWVGEADICRILHAVRQSEHGPDLWVVGADNTGDAS